MAKGLYLKETSLTSIRDAKLVASHFKCFGKEPQGFTQIKPINVLIGRNNSGKSTLLDLLDFATDPRPMVQFSHRNRQPQILLGFDVTSEDVQSKIGTQAFRLELPGISTEQAILPWARAHLIGKQLRMLVSPDREQLDFHDFFPVPDHFDNFDAARLKHASRALMQHQKNPFKDVNYVRLFADRDVVNEKKENTKVTIRGNGDGFTNTIRAFITSRDLNRDLVEVTLLNELNKVFAPDAKFDRLLIEEDANGSWEVLLEERAKGRIALSHSGSGLKTVLLVLANLILVPHLDQFKERTSRFLYCLEELENNLHPALVRRLFLFLREHAIESKSLFFLTTHSSAVIDMFAGDESAQIVHITHDGNLATVHAALNANNFNNILDDLDVRASDLLQTNVVVWVEGPSDRIYFDKWVEIWSGGRIRPGIHYQCVTYGGSILKHYGFEYADEGSVEELISALRVNRNAIVIVDSDKRSESDELKAEVIRIMDETKDSKILLWITAGKEVENYIPVSSFREVFKDSNLKGPGQYADAVKYYREHDTNKQRPKTDIARTIIDTLSQESIAETLDLSHQVTKACAFIAERNGIQQT
jgi:putative ATP-dependent endonuclease of OLD family